MSGKPYADLFSRRNAGPPSWHQIRSRQPPWAKSYGPRGMVEGAPPPNRRDRPDRRDASQNQASERVAAQHPFASSRSFGTGIKAT